MSRAAVGFSTHTGWAASVTVAGPAARTALVDRRRFQLADSPDTVEAEVYHRAAGMSLEEAASLLRKSAAAAARRAARELRALLETRALVAAGIVTSAARLPEELSAILRSHPLVHTAEGAFYRNALVEALERAEISVIRVPRHELADRFASSLGAGAAEARILLDSMGRDAGPPWAKDQKDAAMAAVIALVETSGSR